MPATARSPWSVPSGRDGSPRRARRRQARDLRTALALTFLNPHVYLDTVVLIGGLSVRHQGTAAAAFATGAALASMVWFYGLGFGARLAAPSSPGRMPGNPRYAIGVVMPVLAARPVGEAWSAPH